MGRIISLDLETGGLDPNKHSVLSIGAVDIETKKSHYRYIPHDEFVVTPEAMFVNKIDLSTRTDRRGAREVVSDFYNWLMSIGVDCQNKAKFLGFNVGSFDRVFLLNLFKQYGLDISDYIDYRSIDLNSIISFISDLRGWCFIELKNKIMLLAEDRIYEKNRDIYELGRHNAIYDAWLNVYCYEVCVSIITDDKKVL